MPALAVDLPGHGHSAWREDGDEDAAQFARDAPGFQRTIVVPDAGHSVQGDQPRALVDILRQLLDAQG